MNDVLLSSLAMTRDLSIKNQSFVVTGQDAQFRGFLAKNE
jgi:hypothetical protein